MAAPLAIAATAAVGLGAVIASPGAALADTVPAGHMAIGWRWPANGPVPHPAAGSSHATTTGHQAGALHQVVLPDIFAVAPHGITAAQLARLGKLHYVRNLIAVNGGGVTINGRTVQIIGANSAQFQSWTPLQTAAQQSLWATVGKGGFVTTAAVAKKLGLRPGKSYRVSGARQPTLTFAGTAALGIPGVDAVVGTATSKQLGLLPQIGVLISAPGASLTTLDTQVRGVLGNSTRFVSLRQSLSQSNESGQLPVDGKVPGGRPDSYLALFRDSAALYCPTLSWTVLAAIGQIESADGQNMGPSSAGALGPMQFMPSTWARWGIDAFGETGTPNVMNPYDAVPSAAEYLCASGGNTAAGLPAAVFAYNHAQWYVNEVLGLAKEYAQEYG